MPAFDSSAFSGSDTGNVSRSTARDRVAISMAASMNPGPLGPASSGTTSSGEIPGAGARTAAWRGGAATTGAGAEAYRPGTVLAAAQFAMPSFQTRSVGDS